MNDREVREWIVMHCLDAYKDAFGNPGEHKVPLAGYDTPMTKADALKALALVERARPGEDFSVRRLSGNAAPAIQLGRHGRVAALKGRNQGGQMVDSDEFALKFSPLCQMLTRDGVTLDVQIYNAGAEHPGKWLLEVVNEQDTSICWEAPFDSDANALAALHQTIEQEGIASLTGK
ncbi:MAG: hypothetical protein WBD34_00105 [Burkholderiaceae bacterium]